MSTSDTVTDHQPPPAFGQRRLRRNRTNRVAAGVASGLGDYFGVDPVLFRVLFATSAFFGGAGILAYLLAWAAIPEDGTERAPIDGWVAALRRRNFPVWALVVGGGIFLWIVAFSWWAPGPFFPVIAVIVLLTVFFTRRELQHPSSAPPAGTEPAGPGAPTVNLTKDAPTAGPAPDPTWVQDARIWFDESRAAARERRRRSFPIRVTVFVTLILAITGLGVADAVDGIPLPWYFWTVLVILLSGMLVALITRRWSWSLVPLAVPALVGAIAFAGSDASLHDGVGQREWKPASAPASTHYRLAFGQGTLDLRQLHVTKPTSIKVTMGAGQVKIIAPKTMDMTVKTDIHMGQLEVDGNRGENGQVHGGFEFTRTIDPPAGAKTPPVTVTVELADGNVTVSHQ
jgi:phage shock protein PspC (stress-responsive transcriptional regulator)